MNVSKDKIDGVNGEFIGIAKFSAEGAKKLISGLEKAAKTDLNRSFVEVIDNMLKKGETIAALDIKNSRTIDIDFPEDLEKAKEVFS